MKSPKNSTNQFVKNSRKDISLLKKANDTWAADLIDLRSHSKINGGMKYVLMVIDCFSKFGYGIPSRTKTGSEVMEAFQSLFKKETLRFLWVDRGTEQ